MKTNGFQPIARYFKYQRGFTLLEMVLVLLIMGMVASLSVVFIDNEDNQLRYEETIQKLERMHKATVTVKEYGSGFLFSGFAVDNGVLPSAAKNYVSMPTGWIKRKLFDSSNKPQYRILNADSYRGIDKVSLYKGYRQGYIGTGIDSAGDYKTGWGNDFTVAEDATTHSLNLSYDESLNPPDYVNAVNKDVSFDSWSIALSEIHSLKIINEKATDDIEAGTYLVAISIFENAITTIPGDRWHTFHCSLIVSTISPGGSADFTLSWLKSDASSSASSERIPAGEHPVFLVKSGSHSTIKAQAILKVIPRFTQPSVTLVIKD
jgi:prepilin-type N-terminal cleavage/methylation domain-containing protein